MSSPATNVYSSEPEDKSKAVIASKNITGPPVYYPPNHELFSSKEEGSGYRAQVRVISSKKYLNSDKFHLQGGYARAKGSYAYESESKSKSKSKSGAAVVPLW